MTQQEIKQMIDSLKESIKRHNEWIGESDKPSAQAFWRGAVSSKALIISELENFLDDELEECM